MATYTKIKDFLEPPLYEYYEEHRDKFKHYASDLEALRAQLLYAMTKEHKFPERTDKWDYQLESKCSYWLSWMLRENKDFDGFCQFFWDELKGLKRQTPDFYEKCQWILDNYEDDDVKSVDKKNKSRKEKAVVNRFERKHKRNTTCMNEVYYPTKVQATQSTKDDKYAYHIEKERSYGGYSTIPYIVTKHCRENVYSIQNWDCQDGVERNLHITWKEFLEQYKDYIAGINRHSIDFKYQCYAIILEYKTVEEVNPTSKRELSSNLQEIDKSKAINIDEYVTERIMDGKRIKFVTFNGMQLMPPDKAIIARDCRMWAVKRFGDHAELNDFAEHFASELSLYRPYTDKWYLTCFKLCHENSSQNNSESTKTVGFLPIAGSLILSFFIFGGIAYVFKHLLYLVWFLISNIAILLFNMVVWIFCLLFNLDSPSGMIDFDNMVSPLRIWQIGGWCYGIIITSVLLWQFFMWLGKMSDRFLKK